MKIGFLQRSAIIGGPGSFQTRFINWLNQHGYKVVFVSESKNELPDVILTIGAPLKLLPLLIRFKKKGVPIVHRLAGPYWRYRVEPVSAKIRLEHIIRNWIMHFIRDHLADYVVYQSKFVQCWWHIECSPAPCPETVIINGVDLQEFAPHRKIIDSKNEKLKIIVAETTINASMPTIKILTILPKLLADDKMFQGVEVYGKIPSEVKTQLKGVLALKLMGPVSRKQMPYIFRQRGIFLSIKVNHSCPNVVMEALASGMPVVGFNTGALPELVSPEAGCIVPYGANPWLLEPPDVEGLYKAIKEVAQHLDDYRVEARILAERRFSLESMARAYITVFQNVIAKE